MDLRGDLRDAGGVGIGKLGRSERRLWYKVWNSMGKGRCGYVNVLLSVRIVGRVKVTVWGVGFEG